MPKKIALLTKQLAADRLGMSVRRLMELSAEGRFTRHREFDPETKREAVMFDESEIEAFQRDTAIAPAPGALVVRPRLQAAIEDDDEPAAALGFRLWLTLAEAAEYSGLPASILQAMIERGELAARNVGVRPGGHWRVRKLDVEAIEGERVRA